MRFVAPRQSRSSGEWILSVSSRYSVQYLRSPSLEVCLTICGVCDFPLSILGEAKKNQSGKRTPSTAMVRKEAPRSTVPPRAPTLGERGIPPSKLNAIRGKKNGCYISSKVTEIRQKSLQWKIHGTCQDSTNVSSPQLLDAAAIIPILQRDKLELRKVRWFSQVTHDISQSNHLNARTNTFNGKN